jgi:hypothetical protein
MAILRSIGAVVGGIVVGVAITLAVDQALHMAGVYPPWGERMDDPALNALALGYRIVFQVFAGWLIARLAPSAPATHALVGGVIGLVVSTLGAVAAVQADLGPAWHPIALAVSALPTAWLGGLIRARSLKKV